MRGRISIVKFSLWARCSARNVGFAKDLFHHPESWGAFRSLVHLALENDEAHLYRPKTPEECKK